MIRWIRGGAGEIGRAAFAGGAMGLALLTGECGDVARASEPRALTVREIAAGVWVHEGVQEDVDPANHGDVANIGFVVGSACVAVIDTGTTLAIGRALRDAVRRVTTLPVCYVVNTHVHPDHVLGDAAFAADAPQIVGHARLAAALAARGDYQWRASRRDLGDDAAGSVVVFPTLSIEGDRTIDLGGRVLRLHAWPTAHTDSDLTVHDEATDTWWLSDLLFVDHVPVVDGSVRGWLTALETLAREPQPAHVVPGHGPVDAPWPASLEAERDYLRALVRDVTTALRQHRTIGQSVETIGADSDEHWLLLERFHRRNVTAVYAELEWADR